MADYAWIIDKDHIADPKVTPPSYQNAVGLEGPSHAPTDLLRQLETNPDKGMRFRMYDDDGELYYEGRIIVDQPPGWDLQEEHFGPLWDFGTGNAGCTSIWYFHPGDFKTIAITTTEINRFLRRATLEEQAVLRKIQGLDYVPGWVQL